MILSVCFDKRNTMRYPIGLRQVLRIFRGSCLGRTDFVNEIGIEG